MYLKDALNDGSSVSVAVASWRDKVQETGLAEGRAA